MNEMISDVVETAPTEFSVEDLANPRSVVCLTSGIPTFQKALKRLMETHPEYLDLEFQDIKQRASPTYTLHRARISFWAEYENAIQHNRKMSLTKMYQGVTTERIFRKLLDDDLKFAFLLHPPKDYTITVKEALDAGLDNLRAIATAPVLDEKGMLMPKHAEVVLKAIALLDMRVKGAVIQRIDQRSLNVNLNKDVTPATEKEVIPQSLSELDRQLEAIKSKLIKDVNRSALPSSPFEFTETMKGLGAEVVQVGGGMKDIKDV